MRLTRGTHEGETGQPSPDASSSKRSIPRRIRGAALLWSAWAACAAALVIPTAIWADRSREAALATARADVARATVSSARATENVIGLVDVFLKRLSEATDEAAPGRVRPDQICPSMVCSNNRRLSPYLIMAFARANGDVFVYGSELPLLSLADRDYFVGQRERDAGLYVGHPRRTPFVEGVFLPMSRRLASKDASFDGIVAAAFNTDLIRSVFQGQGIGRLDRVRLLDPGGHPLVDWSADAAAHAAGPACGPSGARPVTEAMASAVKLPVGGLTVDACRSTANALGPWREQVALVAGAEALLLLVSALVLPTFIRRRERHLRQQVGLRGLVAGSSDVQFIIAAKPDGRFVLEALTFTRGGELGRMSARLVGRTTREFFSPEDVDLVEADYRSVLASGQTRRTERRIRLGGGAFTWSTVLVPLSDGSGRGGYIFGAATELAAADGGELEGGLRRFTEDVLRREDAERRRIARELHDTTGQNLIAAGFELAVVERGLKDAKPQVAAALAHARSLVDASVSELRTLAYVLHPALLDEAGLGVALPTLAEGFERRAGVRVTVAMAEDLTARRWSPEIEIALYRVAQEALTNVQRHSVTKAARVTLRPVSPGRLQLVVEDGPEAAAASGSAVPPPVEGAGIRGMRDRIEALGGSLTLTGQDGGLRIVATVPGRSDAPPERG